MESLRRIVAASAVLTWVACLGSAPVAQGAPEVERKFGLIPATQDELRGIPLASLPYSGTELPPSVDLSPGMPPPLDQGGQNSCVGWALAYAVKTYQEQLEERVPVVTPDGRIDARRVFSPGYVYSQVNQGRDGGCKYPDALRLVAEQGVAPWADMPYVEGKPFELPPPAAQAAAKRYRIDTWRQVNVQDPRELKAHLNAGYPVMIGVKVDEGFKALTDGVWGAPSGKELGNHAMVIVGYDDARGAFRLINSWGQGWGQKGYGWVAYDHFRRVANEGYVAKDARNGPAPQPRPEPGPRPEPQPEPPPFQPPVLRAASFALTNIEHNAKFQNDPTMTPHLVFHGTLEIPGGAGYSDQVVVSFFLDDGRGGKGVPMRALAAPYSTVQGQAACGTAKYPVPAEGLPLTQWHAWIPNAALYGPPGVWEQTAAGPVYRPQTTYLVAEPVLFVDGFGVATGGLVRFHITR